MSANLELVRPTMTAPVGMFNVPRCTFTPTGLIIKRGMPIGDWVLLGLTLRKAGDGVQLWLGDWIRYGKHEYGKMYEEAMALTGYKEQTLKNNVWVANKVPIELRVVSDSSSPRGDLKFKHYKTVAALPSRRQIKKWLSRAAEGDGKRVWSASKLHREIIKASQPRQAKTSFSAQLTKLHDKMVREELGEKIAVVKQWRETPVDPLLSDVYRRIVKILEWQRDRTVESDCAAIMRMFTGDEGTEAPERASDGDIAAWLYDRGLLMSEQEIGQADDPERGIQASGRLGLMLKLKLLVVKSREESRQEGRKGSITAVYAVERDYMAWLDEISDYPLPERIAATRKDWKQRVERYAPELAPQRNKAA